MYLHLIVSSGSTVIVIDIATGIEKVWTLCKSMVLTISFILKDVKATQVKFEGHCTVYLFIQEDKLEERF